MTPGEKEVLGGQVEVISYVEEHMDSPGSSIFQLLFLPLFENMNPFGIFLPASEPQTGRIYLARFAQGLALCL